MRKVFLDNLPRRGRTNQINWRESVGYRIKFIYDNMDGWITIIGYDDCELLVEYYNEIFKSHIGHFAQGKSLSKIIKKITSKYKVNIGQVFKDDNRDLIIIDRERRIDKGKIERKWYKYICNKCGWTEGWVEESSLTTSTCGCSCCANRTVVYEINSIHDTAPWMIELGVDFEEAKKFTCQSNRKIKCVCPFCGKESYKQCSHIHKTKSIGCTCSDGFSYPEKYVGNVLQQLGIEFETQYSPKWVRRKRYDFYIPSLNMIIETHGKQHYEQSHRGRTLQEEQENDRIKKELALNNGIEYYIELDCKYSDLDWIKNSILNSKLNEMFNLNNIDWLKCEEYAIKSNLVKEVCNYWNNKEEWETTTDISIYTRINSNVLVVNLKKGAKLGWCDYDVEEEVKKRRKKAISNAISASSKKVQILKDDIILGEFDSIRELERKSYDLFGTKLYNNYISSYCKGNFANKTYKGFTFKYI